LGGKVGRPVAAALVLRRVARVATPRAYLVSVKWLPSV
jgi:hypothetical protein